MDMNRDKMVESILNLTLEILFRLTGEDYAIMKKTSRDHCQAPVSDGWEGNLSPITGSLPPLRTHQDINDQKILELAYKMIELLTGEVPLRCQDVTVYFSMEEWEYLEGHKDRYEDVIMEVPQPRTSPDDFTRDLEEHLITSDFKEEDFSIPQDTYEDHAIFPDKASALHNRDLSSDPIKLVLSSHLSQIIKENEILRQVVQNQRSQGKKTFKCSECGRCFNDKSNLIKHERFHTGEKPYSCLECGKGFADRSNFVLHQRSHTGEKPYSCSDCGKCFTRKSNLENHKRIHKGEKPFSCSECGKCFTDPSSLVMHHRSHTGVKPYSCPECGRCFIRKSVLVLHRIRKHKE